MTFDAVCFIIGGIVLLIFGSLWMTRAFHPKYQRKRAIDQLAKRGGCDTVETATFQPGGDQCPNV